jgi:hypothetical protein
LGDGGEEFVEGHADDGGDFVAHGEGEDEGAAVEHGAATVNNVGDVAFAFEAFGAEEGIFEAADDDGGIVEV